MPFFLRLRLRALLAAFILLSFITPALAKEHIVLSRSGKASEMRFAPEEITIAPGDTVTWVNEKDMYHNIKALKKDIPEGAEPFTSKNIVKAGDRWSHTFTVTGTYNYFCLPHKAMGMVGKIIVTPEAPAANATDAPAGTTE